MASPLFSMASETISAFSFSSRYIFFSRRFSSSNYFMRNIIDTSMPPNLARHL
jgi:aminopeptidase C